MAELHDNLDAFYEGMERAFFDALLGDGDDRPRTERAVHAQRAALYESDRSRATDPQAVFHLRLMTLALAAYRVLQLSVPKVDAFDRVRRAFTEPGRTDTLRGMAAEMDAAPDPFRYVVAASKSQEEHFFGPAFAFERVRDDDDAYELHVSRCFYHRYFSDHDAPELTRLGCDIDANWIDAIDPDAHRVRFERPSTLGYGGDRCRFHFYRLPVVQGDAE